MKNLNRSGLLLQLPKVDLHLHLDGSVKPETALELAIEAGIRLPAVTSAEFAAHMRAQDRCGSLAEYLKAFLFVGPLLHRANALERVAFEVVELAHWQNCKYIEVRFAPQLHRDGGLTAEEVIGHVLNGLRRGESKFGVKARGIAICMRHHADALNFETVDAAAAFLGNGIVAVDLAGDEAAFAPGLFKAVFSRASSYGLPITIHAGEAGGPEHIRTAISELGATRIGHGVRLREDPELLEWVREQRIPLEMCPVSNLQTQASSGWEDYPIRQYVEEGLQITVNTDNLTVSNTSLTKEYELLMVHCGFTVPECCRFIRSGIEAAFLPEPEKEELRRMIDAELASLDLHL